MDEFRKVSRFIDKKVNNVISSVITPSKDHIATQYTSDYNYSRFIPPPCQWYNTKKQGECCYLDETSGLPEPLDKEDGEESRSSECKKCNTQAMNEKRCIYTLETVLTARLKEDLKAYNSSPLKGIMEKVRGEFKSSMVKIKAEYEKSQGKKIHFPTIGDLARGFSGHYYIEYVRGKIQHVGTTDDRIGNNYYAAREMIKLFSDNKNEKYIQHIEVFDDMTDYIWDQISDYGRKFDSSNRVFEQSDILGKETEWNLLNDNEYDNIGWVGDIMQSVEGLYSYKDLIMGGRPSKSQCHACSVKNKTDCKKPRCIWKGGQCTELSDNNKGKMLFGSRYFVKNGLKCRDTSGEPVDAFNYMNSISKNKSLSESMLDDISDLNLDKLIPLLSPPESSTNGVPRCSYITRPEGIHSPDYPTDCSKDEESYKPGLYKCIMKKTRPIIKDVSIIEHFGIDNLNNNTNSTNNNNTNDICNCNFKLYLFFIILFVFLCFLNFYVF